MKVNYSDVQEDYQRLNSEISCLKVELEAKDRITTELRNENTLFREYLDGLELMNNIEGVEFLWFEDSGWKTLNELLTNKRSE